MMNDTRPRFKYQLPGGEVIHVIRDHGDRADDVIDHQLLGGEIVKARLLGPAVTFPVVHLNGSGRSGLYRQYQDAYLALVEALEALQVTAPHGRDYYVRPGTFEAAQREHLDRLERVQGVMHEVAQIIGSLET